MSDSQQSLKSLDKKLWSAAELASDNQLADAAKAAFAGRATDMGPQKLTGDELADVTKAARQDYAAIREIARASFPADAHRIGLSLRGDVPDDTGRFTTLAHYSYTAAGQDPCKTKLTKRGYAATRLTTLLAELDDLTDTGSEQDEAGGEAIDDTDTRDKAYDKLKEFMKEPKGTARDALRGKNGLLAKLGL